MSRLVLRSVLGTALVMFGAGGGPLAAQSPAMAPSASPGETVPEVAALGEAREVYGQIRKKAERSLDLAIEGAISDSAGAGNHAETRRLREVQDAFRKTHQIPEGTGPALAAALDRYRATMRVADKFLEGYYFEAIGVLSREKRHDEAQQVAAARNLWKGTTDQPPSPPSLLRRTPQGTPQGTPAAPGDAGGMPPGPRLGRPPVAVSPPKTGPQGTGGLKTATPAGTPPKGETRPTIVLPAPSIESTNPAPDLEVVRATWGVDPRFNAKKVPDVDVTERVRKQLKGDQVAVSSAIFGEIPEAPAARCLTLTLQGEGGVQFQLRLHEGSEVIARELTPPLDQTNARPIRGTNLMLMLASWGLRDEARGESVAAEYAARFGAAKTVPASTGLFGEPAFAQPKVLRTMWRVGHTLLYVKQAENSEVTVEGVPAAAPGPPTSESPK